MQTDNHTKRNKKKYTLSIRSTEKYIGIQIANEQTEWRIDEDKNINQKIFLIYEDEKRIERKQI